MIRVARTEKPAVIEKKQAAWTQALIGATTPKEKQRAEGKYRHRAIKDALVAMFHGKCAYCESKIVHIDYGHIEHFRPKSKPQFCALSFEWTNLFLSCAVCNGSEYKGDRFPEADEGGLLVNPCDDLPEEHFNFVFDPHTCLATVAGTTERGRTTEKLLGLNRPELRKHRSKLILQLSVLSDFAKTDQTARTLLEEACRDDAEYAAFTRSLVVATAN